jgi:hypothetical protein
VAALERPARPASGLDLVRQVEDPAQVMPIQVGHVDEVAAHQGN